MAKILVVDPIPDGDFTIETKDDTLLLSGIKASALYFYDKEDY
jgi:hypothetical protein